MRHNYIRSCFHHLYARVTRHVAVRLWLVPVCIFSLCALAADNPGKPQYGTWGFDSSDADLQTRPGDNFFRYANGTWLDNTQIPSDKPAYSLRLAMTDRTEQRLRELLEAAFVKEEDAPASLQGKAGAFYHSFMDEARVSYSCLDPESRSTPRASATRLM